MVWPFFSPPAPAPAADETFECDYERDCTPLYKAIESAIEPNEFDPIVKFLDTGYWSGSFFTDPVSPADQAKTWVTRFDPDDSTKVMWSQLPLHLAIVCGAPPAIIGRLVKLFPEGLRCTDDQHMLPLHLALRHNISDEIVAYLLMQFPDAVNASGKSGRSAIECALRAKDKLRGKILEIFVSKSKGKLSNNVLKEQKLLRDAIKSKDLQIDSMTSDMQQLVEKFEEIKQLKETVETDLMKKIQELETANIQLEADAADKLERIENEKMLESLEHQKKYELLEATLAEVQSNEKQAKDVEASLRKELDNIHARVAKSRSQSDWESLKIDVGGMEAYRLQCSHTEAKNQIDILKGELAKTLLSAQKARSVITASGSSDDELMVDKELETDIQLIQQTVSKLEKEEENARSAEELNALREEVEALRNEMRERTGTNRTKLELTILKKAMETELHNAQGKTEEELRMLRSAVAKASKSKLDNKTNAELVALKMDIELLKRQTKNKELVTKVKSDLSDLLTTLDKEIEHSTSAQYNEELSVMKGNAKLLQTHIDTAESTESILLLKKSVDHMKDELKKKEVTSKIMDEVSALKALVESDLKKSEGKTQEELLIVKKQIKTMTDKDFTNKNVDELVKIKSELESVKTKLDDIVNAANIQQELEVLKKTLADEMKITSANAEKELTMMKKAVDEVNMEQKESKNLKKSLTEEIKTSNKKVELELLEMKKTLDSLDVKKLESKNKDAWDAVRKEMDTLKEELAAKKTAKSLSSEIDTIKKVVADLHAKKVATTEAEFNALREDMESMRHALQEKDAGEAELKRELESLKRRSEKKKNGLTKFFTRHFTARKLNEKASSEPVSSDNKSVAANELVSKQSGVSHEGSAVPSNPSITKSVTSLPRYAEATVTTIAPPSMVRGFQLNPASSDDSEEEEEDAQSTGQILAKLSASFVEEPIQAIETVHTEIDDDGNDVPLNRVDSCATTTKSFPTISMPKFRKVQSMDARIASPTYKNKMNLKSTKSMVTTMVVEEDMNEDVDNNGGVIIETVETSIDDMEPITITRAPSSQVVAS